MDNDGRSARCVGQRCERKRHLDRGALDLDCPLVRDAGGWGLELEETARLRSTTGRRRAMNHDGVLRTSRSWEMYRLEPQPPSLFLACEPKPANLFQKSLPAEAQGFSSP